MVCRLCLADANRCIVIFSEQKIQECITKFLQLELKQEDPISNMICDSCWHSLDSFQNFCTKIEQAQRKLIAATEKLQEEPNQNDNAPNKPASPSVSEHNAKESNLEKLKEEHNAEDSDDNSRDNDDTFYCLDEKAVKVEIQNEHATEAVNTSSPKIEESFVTRRVTRRSTLERVKNDIPSDIVLEKKKRGRPRKEPVDKNETTESDKKDDEEDTCPEPNEKRKRGRPKKGEKVTPKVKTVRSEKCSRILQTAKEFDAIIQKNMTLVCNICSIRLTDFAELKRHFRNIHQRRGYAVCCNKRLFKRGLVVDHINTHNNPEHFKCTECGKILADRMCLRNHVLLFHQTEELKVYQCQHCPKKYAKQYLLDHHKIKHVTQDECPYICAECGKGFPTNSTLTKHLNQIHSTVYDKMCEICAKLIRGNAAFERHMEDHEGIVRPQVQCKVCGSWLKDKNSLRKHMYKHDGKTYTCKECGKVAQTKSSIKSHERYVHQLSRKFHCSFCDKSFKKAVNLKEHLTTHTGEILYTCPHCPKTFNSKANMHSHRKKKHREEWEANRRSQKKENTIDEAQPTDVVSSEANSQ